METETMFGTWTIINGVSVYPEDTSIMDAISIEVGQGWCACLSKHDETGILVDCTKWVGPYDTKREALRDLKSYTLNRLGHKFDYDLDGEPYDLREEQKQ